jgi:hypothetical protein
MASNPSLFNLRRLPIGAHGEQRRVNFTQRFRSLVQCVRRHRLRLCDRPSVTDRKPEILPALTLAAVRSGSNVHRRRLRRQVSHASALTIRNHIIGNRFIAPANIN